MQPKYGRKTGYNVGKDKSNEDFIYLHMSNHYRKILNAKKAVDNSPPHSHKVKRPVTCNPSRSSTRRPVENLPLTDRSTSTNSNKESCWGVDSLVVSSPYHARCIPVKPTYKPNLVNNSLNMMLVDRIAYDTKHGPSAYCDESWLEAKPQPKDRHYKSAYEGQSKKIEPTYSASVKRHHSATTSNDMGQKRKLAVQTPTGTSGARVQTSLEPSHCKCPRLRFCDPNEIAVKKISHNPKEQSLTSSRDSAYNGGVSSGPESRSPTPDQRKKKECCCCCCCDRKQRETSRYSKKPSPSASSSPRPPESIDTPRTIPKKNEPSLPPTPKKNNRYPPPLPPKTKDPDLTRCNQKSCNTTPSRDDPTVPFSFQKNNEHILPHTPPKNNPTPSPRTVKVESSTPTSSSPRYDEPMLSSFTINDKPVPSPRTSKKSYPVPPQNSPRESTSTSPPPNIINVDFNQSVLSLSENPPKLTSPKSNKPPSVEKKKNLVDEQESFKKLQEDAMYVTFIQDITMEVLQKNLYTNKALKKVMKKHIQNNIKNLDKDRMLKEVNNLKIQLGIPKDDSILNLAGDLEENVELRKFYPTISDSEFVMPKMVSLEVSKSGTDTSESLLKSVSMISDKPISTTETDEDVISVVEVTKAVRERRKEIRTEETIGGNNSSDDSDRPSDPKKRTLPKMQKTSRSFSSSSSDREHEDSSKDTFLGDMSLFKKNKNVSFWANPDLNGGVEIKHKKTVTRTKESIRRYDDCDCKQKCD